MRNIKISETVAAGLAIFSMFFGAGNIIFPLALGYQTADKIPYAMAGLLVTAVLIPFLGLLAIFLYKGNILTFFSRLGNRPGLFIAFFIISLLGPLGSTPRCIALAHSTWSMSFPSISVPVFSAIACGLIYLFACRRNQLLDLLGYVLTPFLVFCLALIIIKGLAGVSSLSYSPSQFSTTQAIWYGLIEGYNTMDLLAAFFFAPVIISALQRKLEKGNPASNSIQFALKASLLGAFLLAIIYIGFGYLAYYYAGQVGTVASEQLLAAIALHVLGAYGGVIVCITVVLACLTTAIALIAAFTEFVHREIFKERIKEKVIMSGALAITFIVATFEFRGISQFLSPVLQILYPVLILLTLWNVAEELIALKQVAQLAAEDKCQGVI